VIRKLGATPLRVVPLPAALAAWEESTGAGLILLHEMGEGTARRAVERVAPPEGLAVEKLHKSALKPLK
jgi:hypothetical protein